PPTPTLFPYTTLFRSPGRVGSALVRSRHAGALVVEVVQWIVRQGNVERLARLRNKEGVEPQLPGAAVVGHAEKLVARNEGGWTRSEEHTSELQSRSDL